MGRDAFAARGAQASRTGPEGTRTGRRCPRSGTSDGAYPIAGLITDGAGDLYNTTNFCGADGYGAVFKLAPDR
jgi:hypothetical protein